MHSWDIIHWIIELCISKYLSLCVSGCFSQIWSHICSFYLIAFVQIIGECNITLHGSLHYYFAPRLPKDSGTCICTIQPFKDYVVFSITFQSSNLWSIIYISVVKSPTVGLVALDVLHIILEGVADVVGFLLKIFPTSICKTWKFHHEVDFQYP